VRVGLWIGTAVAGVVALWLLLAYGSANVDRVTTGFMGAHPDFDTFHRSAQALLHGRPIYDTGAALVNLNPPIWTILFVPFGLLDVLVSYRIFEVLTAVLIVGSSLVVARELRVGKGKQAIAALAMLVSSPLMGTVALGQVYGVLVAGLVASWIATRRGRHVLAGVFLGLVIALKPTLAPLLLLLIGQRHWPALKAAVAAIAGGTLLGLVVAGPQTTWRWLNLLKTEGLSTFGDNASLPSLIARLGGPAWLGFLLGAVVVVVTVRRTNNLWALVAATLLLSPIAWHNYLVLCFPGVFTLRRRSTAAFLLALPLIGVEWGMHLWKGDSLADHLGSSLYCFVLVSYWLALSAVQDDRDDPGEVREAGDLGRAEHRPAGAAHQ
jgi:glycosyl transferase family 87